MVCKAVQQRQVLVQGNDGVGQSVFDLVLPNGAQFGPDYIKNSSGDLSPNDWSMFWQGFALGAAEAWETLREDL